MPRALRPQGTPPKTLDQFARRFGFTGPATDADVAVHGVTLSTGDIRQGDLFVGAAGNRQHGAVFAAKARSGGAVAVLTDKAGARLAQPSGLPVLVADDPRSTLGQLSAWLYGTESRAPRLFGVTGTNGKTSTVHLLEAILVQLGVRAGLSSTAERHVAGTSIVSGLTTPEATELHGLLARMVEEQVEAAAIEVSAQGLTKGRVEGIDFDVAGFTNLSHDHLDDYGDMRNYLLAKATLFQPGRARSAVVSLDSGWGTEIHRLAGVPVTTISSRPDVAADWHVEITAAEPRGVAFTLNSAGGETLSTRLPVIGGHMAANAGLAIAMLVEGGYELSRIATALEEGIDVYIPGRSERISGPSGPAVFVDFGHSPDAFANTLDAVRQVTEGKVIMVFGADGDRDATKRSAMAEAAVLGSDVLIVTDHHPRFEDPTSIRAVLIEAALEADPNHETIEVPNPKLAIRAAVRLAAEGDSILWAGPGHQDYRDIEGVHVPYSARYEARSALQEAGWYPGAETDLRSDLRAQNHAVHEAHG
ncbi:MAG: UDP-N-acetylmuramyl-tripeptide synthetase [Rhodoglobus sp.]|nr:UDP-N-acetylmuramyl-tripeptide synthetase [Rhodoglobus sp.]